MESLERDQVQSGDMYKKPETKDEEFDLILVEEKNLLKNVQQQIKKAQEKQQIEIEEQQRKNPQLKSVWFNIAGKRTLYEIPTFDNDSELQKEFSSLQNKKWKSVDEVNALVMRINTVLLKLEIGDTTGAEKANSLFVEPEYEGIFLLLVKKIEEAEEKANEKKAQQAEERVKINKENKKLKKRKMEVEEEEKEEWEV